MSIKNKLIFSAIIFLLLALSVQTYRAQRLKIKYEAVKSDLDNVIELNIAKETELKTYFNKVGDLIYTVSNLEFSLKSVNDLRETEHLQYLSKFEKLKKDLRNVSETGVFEFILEEDKIPNGTTYIPCKDSVKVFEFKLKDEWNNIRAMVVDTPKFSITVPVYYVDNWDRKWFLGKKTWERQSMTPNKLVKITAMTVIEVKRKKGLAKIRKRKSPKQ